MVSNRGERFNCVILQRMRELGRAAALMVITLASVACGGSVTLTKDDAGSQLHPGADGGSCNAAPAGAARVVTMLASSGAGESNGIAVQDADIYWAIVDWGSDAGPSGVGYLQTMPTSGGAVTILATGQVPLEVVADSTNVYWTSAPDPDGGGSSNPVLHMTPRAAGPSTVIATGLAPGIALGPMGVYWVNADQGNAVMRTPLGGGPATTLDVTPAGDQIGHLALDATNLYWTDLHAVPGTGNESMSIVKMPLAGGASSALTTLPTRGGFASLAVGPSSVVWVDYQGVVQSTPIAGGPLSTLYSDSSGGAAIVAVDCGFVYWATGTQVMKAPLSGGSPTVLASYAQGWGYATGFAFDDTSLYFAKTSQCADARGCAMVMKVTPK
jgi:hypothetical protein